ncbi:Protein of unknown function [Cotesia congregata]|uniref:Uncharacterized protein n=1 Tax=Cotesia congregata TaxID=51543 RepID=A0A8J2EIA8_COTCN|nr:Protein of unknown function [Cotesia congregata]
MRRTNKNSEIATRNSTIGNVSNLHNLARKVVPSSGRFITSFKGGKTLSLAYLRMHLLLLASFNKADTAAPRLLTCPSPQKLQSFYSRDLFEVLEDQNWCTVLLSINLQYHFAILCCQAFLRPLNFRLLFCGFLSVYIYSNLTASSVVSVYGGGTGAARSAFSRIMFNLSSVIIMSKSFLSRLN